MGGALSMQRGGANKRIGEIYALFEGNDELSNFVADTIADTLAIRIEAGMAKEDGWRIMETCVALIEKVAGQEARQSGQFDEKELFARIKRAAIEFRRLRQDGQFLQ